MIDLCERANDKGNVMTDMNDAAREGFLRMLGIVVCLQISDLSTQVLKGFKVILSAKVTSGCGAPARATNGISLPSRR